MTIHIVFTRDSVSSRHVTPWP